MAIRGGKKDHEINVRITATDATGPGVKSAKKNIGSLKDTSYARDLKNAADGRSGGETLAQKTARLRAERMAQRNNAVLPTNSRATGGNPERLAMIRAIAQRQAGNIKTTAKVAVEAVVTAVDTTAVKSAVKKVVEEKVKGEKSAAKVSRAATKDYIDGARKGVADSKLRVALARETAGVEREGLASISAQERMARQRATTEEQARRFADAARRRELLHEREISRNRTQQTREAAANDSRERQAREGQLRYLRGEQSLRAATARATVAEINTRTADIRRQEAANMANLRAQQAGARLTRIQGQEARATAAAARQAARDQIRAQTAQVSLQRQQLALQRQQQRSTGRGGGGGFGGGGSGGGGVGAGAAIGAALARGGLALGGGAGLGAVALQAIKLADEYRMLEARVSLVTKSELEHTAVMNGLQKVAIGTRAKLNDVGTVYYSLARNNKALGQSQGELLNITKAINQTVAISGTSAQAASFGLIQLGQAFGTGQLRGEELNSVLEQLPGLAEHIVKGINKVAPELGVQIPGQLKTLAEDGKLTVTLLVKAIKAQFAEIEAQFKKMPVTVGQGMTVARNGIQIFIHEFDKATAATEGLGRMFANLGRWLANPATAQAAANIGNAIANIAKAIAESPVGQLAKAIGESVYYMILQLGGISAPADKFSQSVRFMGEALLFAVKAFILFKAVALASVVFGPLLTGIKFVINAYRGLTAAAAIGGIAMSANAGRAAASAAVFSGVVAPRILAAQTAMYTLRTAGVALLGLMGGPWVLAAAGLGTAIYGLHQYINGSRDATGQYVTVAHKAAEAKRAVQDITERLIISTGKEREETLKLANAKKQEVADQLRAARAKIAGAAASLIAARALREEAYAHATRQSAIEGGGAAALGGALVSEGREKQAEANFKSVIASVYSLANDLNKIVGAVKGPETPVPTGFNPMGKDDKDKKKKPRTRKPKEDPDPDAWEALVRQMVPAIDAQMDFVEGQRLLNKFVKEGTPAHARFLEVLEKRRDEADPAKEMLRVLKEENSYLSIGNSALRDRTKAFDDYVRAIQKHNPAELLNLAHQLGIPKDRIGDVDSPKQAEQLGDAIIVTARKRKTPVTAYQKGLDEGARDSLETTLKTTFKERVRTAREEVKLFGLRGVALEREKLILDAMGPVRDAGLYKTEEEIRNHVLVNAELMNSIGLIAELNANPPQRSMFNGARDALVAFRDEAVAIGDAINSSIGNALTGLTDTFVDFAMTGKLAFKDFARSIIADMLRMIAKMLIMQAIIFAMEAIAPGSSRLLSIGASVAGAGAGAANAAKGVNVIPDGKFLGRVSHAGSIAGSAGGWSRTASAAAFAGAERFHSGGLAGLRKGEVPIIAQKGEAILPTVRLPNGKMGVQASGMGGGGSMVFAPTITVQVQGGGGDPSQQEKLGQMIAGQVDALMEAKMQEFSQRNLRPGGMFRTSSTMNMR